MAPKQIENSTKSLVMSTTDNMVQVNIGDNIKN